MITFQKGKSSNTFIRFGRLFLDDNEYYDLPSIAPMPRKEYEIDSMMQLKSDGASFPVMIAPLSKRRQLRNFIQSSVITENHRIIAEIKGIKKTFMIPDPESEIFSLNVSAREDYKKDKTMQKILKESLLKTGLSENKDNGYKEYSQAWDEFKQQIGLPILRAYEEKIQSELGSPIFFAPTPLIRNGYESVDRAFKYGIEMMATTQKQSFKGIGLHLLVHAELFGQYDYAEETRTRLVEKVKELGKQRDIRITSFPFISFKIFDPNNFLSSSNGTQASTYRQNLSNTITSLAENLRSMNGLLIAHNFGRWSLGAIDSGADIVGFRCDAQVFTIETFWHRHGKVKPKKFPLPPFDPVKMSDGLLKEYKTAWLKHSTFPHPPHVEPVQWWVLLPDEQLRYRSKTIVDSHLELGKEVRECVNSEIPVSESISSRVSRMAEQDPMFDLCPSMRDEWSS